MGYMDSSPHPLPDGWEKHPWNVEFAREREASSLRGLFRKYKLETYRMAKQDQTHAFIGWLIGALVLTVFFSYDLFWITGLNPPFAIKFLTVAVIAAVIGLKYRHLMCVLFLVTWAVGLLLIYSGVATPFLHLG